MNEYKKIIFNEFSVDCWTFLKNASLPILIYGMGNGADKIISVLKNTVSSIRMFLQVMAL